MSYKKSKFNFIYNRSRNENVIYNTFSKALVVLDDSELECFHNMRFTDSDMVKCLVENRILIEDSFDEMGFLKYEHYKTKFSNDTLFLTIAPTLDCNFACPYCYENRRSGKMSKDVQNALVSFVEDAVKSGTYNLDISWYGGEPLLYIDILEDMSRRIMEIATKNKCQLKMQMVTNGFLLSADIVELLDEIGITKIQITLDGLKDRHDIRRPLRNGDGTFDKIISNLSLFADSPIEVLIRMNVDNKNCKDFPILKGIIDSLENPNMKLYISPVEDINKDTINTVSDFMTTSEFDEFTIKSCKDGGISADDFAVMDDRYCFCTAETENCYVVDEKGNFYKCWDEVGREEYKCFNILDMDNINYSQIASYVATDPFSNPKCSECMFLPLCFGGCTFQKKHLDKSVCGFTNDVLKGYIESAYFGNYS